MASQNKTITSQFYNFQIGLVFGGKVTDSQNKNRQDWKIQGNWID
ncbi:MAG: hypothetical protein ACXWFZ_12215 [Nitrososphaeraceae archaeon]